MTESPKNEIIEATCRIYSPTHPVASEARLRAGRNSIRTRDSRLNTAPPSNSIRYYRRRAGMTLEDVAKNVGVSRETIRKLEERDTWLDTDRTAQIARALNVPKEVLGFSYAADAYGWAAKPLLVVGSITPNDEISFGQTGRRVAGGPHLPPGSVALNIRHGKMRGWLLVYREDRLEPMSSDVLIRQGSNENFISHLTDGTTWWRHITPAAKHNLFHLNSRHVDPLNDVEIEWVAQIVGIEAEPFELPTPEQLDVDLRLATVPRG